MTEPEYPVTIAHGHQQGGLTATGPETLDAVVFRGGLGSGKLARMREAAELYGGAAVVLTVDDGQADPRIDDLRAARRIQRRGWPKPARAGRRRSRQARSSRPRALRRAIARGLDPELAKREHWAHGGERHP